MNFFNRKNIIVAICLCGSGSALNAMENEVADPSFLSTLSREKVLDLLDQATMAVDSARQNRCDVRRAEMLLAEGKEGGDQPSWGYARAAYLAYAAMRAIGDCGPSLGQGEIVETTDVATLTPSPPAESLAVQAGDNLWSIAARPEVYGDPTLWPLLYKANVPPIGDADLLRPGQVLTIPRNADDNERQIATEHALHRGDWEIGLIEPMDRRYLESAGIKQ